MVQNGTFWVHKPKITNNHTLANLFGTKTKKKILSVLKNGAKMNVFQLIWEMNGPKLSNMVNNDQNHAYKGREWPKMVKNRPKFTGRWLRVQIRAKKG